MIGPLKIVKKLFLRAEPVLATGWAKLVKGKQTAARLSLYPSLLPAVKSVKIS